MRGRAHTPLKLLCILHCDTITVMTAILISTFKIALRSIYLRNTHGQHCELYSTNKSSSFWLWLFLKKKKGAVSDKLYGVRCISQKLQNETANKMEDNIRSN